VNQLYSAYVGTIFAPNNGNGWRGVQIERLGAVEVRLIEFAEKQPAIELRTWIELYDHGFSTSFDGFRCESLDEAELLLEQLMRSAQRLTESPTDLGPPTVTLAL
jgi:hypothetical protein